MKKNIAKEKMEDFTNQFIRDIENNIANERWELPFTMAIHYRNNGQPYRGINQMMLSYVSNKRKYPAGKWYTHKMVSEMGGNIIKGEKAAQIVNVSPVYEDKDDPSSKIKYFSYRYFNVFHQEQIEGVDIEKKERFNSNTLLDVIVRKHKPIIDQHNDIAAFIPDEDRIVVPNMDQFKSEERYYSTLFHELIHWSGHKDRLKREMCTDKSDVRYATEELVAEIGAAILTTESGYNSYEIMHREYVHSWLSHIKDKSSALADAAKLAVDAVLYLMEEV